MLHLRLLPRVQCLALSRQSVTTLKCATQGSWRSYQCRRRSISQYCNVNFETRQNTGACHTPVKCDSNLVSLSRLPNHTCARSKQTNAHGHAGLGDVSKKEFMELYFITNISFLRVLCRFSKLSGLLFLFGAPASFLSTQVGMLSAPMGTTIVTWLAGYAVLFTTQSFLFSSRVVGKIMMSSDEETVKVSHLSLFGHRRDVFCRPSDILPSKKERGGGYIDENFCQMKIKGYPKRLLYLPNQGHIDTDHERIDMMLSGEFSKPREH